MQNISKVSSLILTCSIVISSSLLAKNDIKILKEYSNATPNALTQDASGVLVVALHPSCTTEVYTAEESILAGVDVKFDRVKIEALGISCTAEFFPGGDLADGLWNIWLPKCCLHSAGSCQWNL